MANTRGPLFVLALVGAILLGTGIAYWLERGQPRERRDGSAEVREQHETPAQRAPARANGGQDEHAGRMAAPEGEPRRPPEIAVAPALPRGELLGRVVDQNGRPLAGARVALVRGEAREFTVLDHEASRIEIPVAETLSDGSGAFRFELARGAPVDVHASLDGFCDALQPDAYAGQELVLVLDPGVLVFGTITRARDGTPVEGAQVRVFPLGSPATFACATTSQPDGSYRLRIAFRADATLEVVPPVEQASGWIELELGSDDRCQRDVAVADGLVVEGRVTDALTGLPIAGATVGEGWWFRRTATTDARGDYRLPGCGTPGVGELGVRARGYTSASTTRLPAAADGLVRLDFALQLARSVRGRVVDESGAPIEDAYVAAVGSAWMEGAQRSDWQSTRTGADGRYRIADLAHDLGHALLVIRQGYGTQVHDLPERELETRELELEDIVLRRPALLAGRVEDPEGHGLAGVELELLGWNHDRYRFTKEPTARGRRYVDRREARSDARGRFWFGSLAAGRYQLVTRVAGRPESTPLELEIRTGEQREDLVLELDARGTIRGRVLDEHGNPLAGVYVSAQGTHQDGDALPVGHVHVRSGDDGGFELAGLPEGEYLLRAYPLETPSSAAGEPWLPATVERVATGSQAVRIELPRGASIRGRVLDAHGTPLAGYVVAGAKSGATGEFAQTDAQGRFSLSVPRDSTWTLEVRGPPQGQDFQTVFLKRESVAAGTELELRLER